MAMPCSASSYGDPSHELKGNNDQEAIRDETSPSRHARKQRFAKGGITAGNRMKSIGDANEAGGWPLMVRRAVGVPVRGQGEERPTRGNTVRSDGDKPSRTDIDAIEPLMGAPAVGRK